MQVGNINSYGTFKNTPNFNGLLVKPEEAEDFLSAAKKMCGGSPEVEKAAVSIFGQIDRQSTKLGKDCVLTGCPPFNGDDGTTIAIYDGDSYTVSDKTGVMDEAKPLAELTFPDVKNLPSAADIIKALESFKTQALASLEKYKSTLGGYVSYNDFVDYRNGTLEEKPAIVETFHG